MTALPQWVRPQLTQLVDAAPEGDQWLHEIKCDGYRMHARLDRGAVKLLTRTALDWTHKYPAIAETLASLAPRQVYLDGELCGVSVPKLEAERSREIYFECPGVYAAQTGFELKQ